MMLRAIGKNRRDPFSTSHLTHQYLRHRQTTNNNDIARLSKKAPQPPHPPQKPLHSHTTKTKMPLIRLPPPTTLRATRYALTSIPTTSKPITSTTPPPPRTKNPLSNPSGTREFSSSTKCTSADHGDHFDPPTGWLWGVKPGEKVEKEGWENIFIYGFFGSLAVGVVGYAFKPDTS